MSSVPISDSWLMLDWEMSSVPNGINLSQLVTTPAFADIYHIRARRDLLSE
jgi:hypothetical protein